MSKKKVDSTSLILKIVAIVTGILTFVGMAFDFIKTTSKQIESLSTAGTMGDWFDSIDLASKLDLDYAATWQISRTFMYITFVVVAIIAIICVLKLFLNIGLLNLIMKIAAIVGIVVSLVFFIALFVGCIQASGEISTTLPSVGPYVIAIAGIVTSGLGIAIAKK